MNEVITVDDVLNARIENVRSIEVRSIAPAVVLILEQEAPARVEFLRDNEDEEDALVEWARGNDVARRVITEYLGKDDDDSERWAREDDHAARLDAGERPESLRLTVYE